MITKEDLARAIKEMGQRMEALQREVNEQIKETAKQMKKTDEQMKKTDEKLKRIGIHLGGISNNQGDVAEEFFYNSLKDNLTIGDIKFDMIDKNIKPLQKNRIKDEYDILLINGKEIAIVEVKYKAHPNDIKKLIDKKAKNFEVLFPEFKEYKKYLALATFSIDDKLKNEALNSGVSVLQRKGDVIETTMSK